MTAQESMKLDIISAYIGSPLTDEQKEFASNFTVDTISFSDPGTGKTHTLIAGLLMAQGYHHIDGKAINCMSFTNAATNEMAGRYEKLCKKCSIAPTVVFNTFHKLSNTILRDAYPNMHVVSKSNAKQDVEDMQKYMQQVGISTTDNKYIRSVIRAIDSLNSALVFHPENLATKFDFVNLNMDLDKFQELRKLWFTKGMVTNTITQGDIPLYCLYALMRKPDVITKWKGKYAIMVVDEFQDLSLLHLRILSYIAKTLIVIGDMKQQIYLFNGACKEIVKEYSKLHPNARVCNLTKSFRCGQEIAEFATNIIRPSDPSTQCFTGHTRGSSVEIIQRRNMDWKKIVEGIESDRKTHGVYGARDVMFLYRNNASAIPVIDQLYKMDIPFRCTKFCTVMEVPMFKSMSKLINAAWHPEDPGIVNEALLLFPEFKGLPFGTECPPVAGMRSSMKGIFDIKYRFKEKSSADLLGAMFAARKAISENKSAGNVYMQVMSVYERYIYPNEWWELDNEKEFYFNLVAPVCNAKTYPLMYNEELDKLKRNRESIQAGTGIRCYTMHTAKGLEADDVYILDCDEGTFPNAKVMEKKIKAGCYLDVAADIQSERNLLYVAITRAKDRVFISYSGAEPAKLITEPNSPAYCQYDSIYANQKKDYDDAAEFFKLFKIEV